MSNAPTQIEQPSEEELVRRSRSGDETVLDDIAEYYGDGIMRMLRRKFPDLRDLAEDVFYDALMSFWRSRNRYDPKRAKLSSWLFTLARRRAIDLMRCASYKARSLECSIDADWLENSYGSDSHDEYPLQTRTATSLAESPSPVDMHSTVVIAPGTWRKLRADLDRILEQLGEIDHCIILAWADADADGTWAAALAAELGVSANALRVRRYRAFQRLCALLEESGHEIPKDSNETQ